MTQTGNSPGKGKAFFDRADQVAETGNWDFAIEMYLQGIQREPENIDRGHKPLREVSLMRTAKGGKSAGMMEKMKHGPSKDPLTSLINAEYLMAKEPGSEAHMEQTLKAAQALECKPLAIWVANILMESQRQATKKNKRLLQELTAAYTNIEEYGLAIQACEFARQADPDNQQVQKTLSELMTKNTIKAGGYDQEGSFTKGVKDMKGQQKLIEKDKISQSEGYRQEHMEGTLQEYLANPTIPGKVNAYVDALLNMGDEGYENTAVDVLNKAFHDTNSYQYKMKIGDIRIKQMTRRYRKLRDSGDKAATAQALREQLEFELQEFGERALNYPTDMGIKFKLGQRQLAAGKLDEAISSLQQARRDARHSVTASSLLGQAFEKKGWHREAAETLENILQGDLNEDNIKDVRYNLGLVYEKIPGELAKAQEHYSHVAQVDYNYKDVRQRLEEVRRKMGDTTPS